MYVWMLWVEPVMSGGSEEVRAEGDAGLSLGAATC